MDKEKKELLDEVLGKAPKDFTLTISVETLNEYIAEKLQYN